jgi:hypothetical protein
MSEELQTYQEPTREIQLSAFSGAAAFAEAQRMAKLLGASSLVPQTYRGNIPDCVIALEMANRIGASPLAVMQNLYIVHGRPAWSSQFLIACINASGKFSPLRYAITGEKNTDERECFAWATDRTGERLEGPGVSIGMAKAEGWFTKNGSKWQTMPELMLRYRAATLFARTYAPELTMGIHTDDEVIDITPVVTDPVPRRERLAAAPPDIDTAKPEPVTDAQLFEHFGNPPPDVLLAFVKARWNYVTSLAQLANRQRAELLTIDPAELFAFADQ